MISSMGSLRSMLRVVTAVAALAIFTSSAGAADITFSATVGTRSASAKFAVSGSDLIVTLTNTSNLDAMVPVDVLTAVFWNVSGTPLTLTRVSAIVPNGHSVFFGPTDPGNSVGGEWAYKSGLSGPGSTSYGISSAGFGLFAPGDRFPGNDLQPPASVNGLEYGITTAGDNLATGNAPMTGDNALIKNQVVFTLSGLPANFDPSTAINNVLFQYGTDLGEPRIPEPATLSLMAVSAVALLRRRR